jgi:hypothetical protein
VQAIGALWISAAGESGHALLKRGRAARTIRYRLGPEAAGAHDQADQRE